MLYQIIVWILLFVNYFRNLGVQNTGHKPNIYLLLKTNANEKSFVATPDVKLLTQYRGCISMLIAHVFGVVMQHLQYKFTGAKLHMTSGAKCRKEFI